MRIWLALIVAPLLALTDQVIAFALVGWACAHQTVGLVHASHAFSLVLVSAIAGAAGMTWRQIGAAAGRDGEAGQQRRFLAGVATVIAAFSAAAIVAMWLPTWMISSCIA
jgi:hypothetical protein